ncbi:hypothetical protein K4K57_006154 [Colletotrichum sp. SAR 10_99]|nr:hypothetical protein K4K57_006154 [Colletotrichum sp. SAR 10_99]
MAPRRIRKDIMSDQVQMKKQEESRQRLQKRLAEQTSGPVERVRGLAQNTRNARTALWETSASYFRDIAGKDPKEVWLGLCKDDREAEIICQDFLEHYLRNSESRRLVFGPEESEDALTITCALTMQSLWKDLVTEADD